MRVERLIATEVVVPAREGAINSSELHRPLHRTPYDDHPPWTVQFDEIPKLVLEAELDNGLVAIGECHRGHDWNVVGEAASRLVGTPLDRFDRQTPPIPEGPERIGFECLAWDGIAKSHALSMVELFGGRARERVPVSAWSGHRTSEDAARIARTMAAAGHAHLKLKCDLRDDVVSICRAIAAAAPALKITLDPNERWGDVDEARRRLVGLEPLGNVHCVEDPIPHEMLEEYRSLRSATRIPIAIHIALPLVFVGQRIGDAIRVIRADAVDAFNFTGGPSAFPRLAHVAAAADVPFWLGSQIDLGVLEALYVHMAASASGSLWPCDIFGRHIRSHDLLESPLRIEPPWVRVPDGPGLGVRLDADALLSHTTRREEFA